MQHSELLSHMVDSVRPPDSQPAVCMRCVRGVCSTQQVVRKVHGSPVVVEAGGAQSSYTYTRTRQTRRRSRDSSRCSSPDWLGRSGRSLLHRTQRLRTCKALYTQRTQGEHSRAGQPVREVSGVGVVCCTIKHQLVRCTAVSSAPCVGWQSTLSTHRSSPMTAISTMESGARITIVLFSYVLLGCSVLGPWV